jgi:hypothetical protein
MEKTQTDLIFKIFGVVILILIGLFVLTWAGYIKCNSIPFWCDIYDMVLGPPKVLVVFGDEGLGNPEDLRLFLTSPIYLSKQDIDFRHIDSLSSGNISEYSLVLVTHCKVMSYSQIEMFINYVNSGGRLIWTGDAGTVVPENEISAIENYVSLSNIDFNPWIRVKEDALGFYELNFSEILGVSYFGNYCELKSCSENNYVGILEKETDNQLVRNLSQRLDLRVLKDNDLAIVNSVIIPSGRRIMSIDFGSVIHTDKGMLNKKLPFITTSGAGGKVIYYALPVEYLVSDNNYLVMFSNMYLGGIGR